MTLIAFDHGTHKIGVASGNAITGTATPLPALPCRDGQPDWDQMTALLEEWRPETLVVGLPLNMDGSESESSQRERTGTRRADPKVDSMAAAVIAEGYLGGATPVAP